MGQTQRKPADTQPVPATSDVDVERWLTRAEAAELLGVSVNTVLNHERLGRIDAKWIVTKNQDGRMRNTPVLRVGDVLKLPRRDPKPTPDNPDELCARAFALFEKGKNSRQVVIELRATYQKISAIYEEWLDSGGVALTLSESNKRELEGMLGKFDNTDELVCLVRESKA